MISVVRAFDVELLYMAQRLHMPVIEVGVNWKEIEGVELYVYMMYCVFQCVRLPQYYTNVYPLAFLLACYISGSKLVPFWSWLQMGRDILFIRLRYMFGIWTMNPRKQKHQ